MGAVAPPWAAIYSSKLENFCWGGRRLIRTRIRIRIRTRNRTRIRIRARIRNSSSRLTQQEMVKELRLENRLRKRRPRQMEQKLWMLQMLF